MNCLFYLSSKLSSSASYFHQIDSKPNAFICTKIACKVASIATRALGLLALMGEVVTISLLSLASIPILLPAKLLSALHQGTADKVDVVYKALCDALFAAGLNAAALICG